MQAAHGGCVLALPVRGLLTDCSVSWIGSAFVVVNLTWVEMALVQALELQRLEGCRGVGVPEAIEGCPTLLKRLSVEKVLTGHDGTGIVLCRVWCMGCGVRCVDVIGWMNAGALRLRHPGGRGMLLGRGSWLFAWSPSRERAADRGQGAGWGGCVWVWVLTLQMGGDPRVGWRLSPAVDMCVLSSPRRQGV